MSYGTSRRDFLKGTAWMGAVAFAGCSSFKMTSGFGAPMQGFVSPILKKIRVGVVGIGRRGNWACERLSQVPGVFVTEICDVEEFRVKEGNVSIAKSGKPAAKTYVGPEEWKRICESDDVDLVYITAPWELHVPCA